jgi:hypothetical protein
MKLRYTQAHLNVITIMTTQIVVGIVIVIQRAPEPVPIKRFPSAMDGTDNFPFFMIRAPKKPASSKRWSLFSLRHG